MIDFKADLFSAFGLQASLVGPSRSCVHLLLSVSILAPQCRYLILTSPTSKPDFLQSFTAVVDHVNLAPDHFRLVGYSYLWMFFIWGTAFRTAELEAKAMKARGWTFPVRKRQKKWHIILFSLEWTLTSSFVASMGCIHDYCLVLGIHQRIFAQILHRPLPLGTSLFIAAVTFKALF